MSRPRILVIKLGALGDVIQALGPMAAIRTHHAEAEIHLLTTAPFAAFLEATGYADKILTDTRPGNLDIPGWLHLRAMLRDGTYQRVYDLQTSGRSGRYFKLFWPGPKPEWSGIAAGCSHPHANPNRDHMHTIERQAEQLAMAGIESVPKPDLSNIQADISQINLPDRYAVFVPGGAAHRPEKRWPIERYATLADSLSSSSVPVVVVGGSEERALAKAIPDAIDLTGKTSLIELTQVMRGAEIAIGNDSGPMHMAAAVGTKCVVLFSNASDPALCAQRGKDVSILRRERLDDLEVNNILDITNI